jgi:hypothetical protein
MVYGLQKGILHGQWKRSIWRRREDEVCAAGDRYVFSPVVGSYIEVGELKGLLYDCQIILHICLAANRYHTGAAP